ncbi:MAG: glycerophosphodiester phosphodiesterase [Firmicutes bacterium]|jgi:glycerophosphoryl diester phosphodiesterase|nr:glycerophosphodiester phosphodiesterase [Bacillota bacterium]
MVNVVAHRGFSGKYPENTLRAFREALVLDVDTVEFDVRLTKDNELVLIHDPTVDRTTNGQGRVEEMTLAEIKELDAGSWMSPEFTGERIPTLAEALDLLGGRVRLNIHLKPLAATGAILVERVIEELKQRRLFDQCFIACDEETLVLAKEICPEVDICNLSKKPLETYVSRSLAIGCRILQPGNRDVTRQLIEEAHRHDMEVNPFYADDEEEMRRLIDCGVDGILTNRPDVLLAVRAT